MNDASDKAADAILHRARALAEGMKGKGNIFYHIGLGTDNVKLELTIYGHNRTGLLNYFKPSQPPPKVQAWHEYGSGEIRVRVARTGRWDQPGFDLLMLIAKPNEIESQAHAIVNAAATYIASRS